MKKTPDEVIVDLLLAIAKERPPDWFRPFLFGGVLANTLGQLPEEYWQKFCKVEPCGRAGCDCHISGQALASALTALRDEWKKVQEKIDYE